MRDADSREAEFAEFMMGRWPWLVRLAYALTGDWGHAEDLAQTAFTKALISWPRLRRADDPDAYLRRILLNVNRSRFRKRRVPETGAAPQEHTLTVCDGTDALHQRSALVAALMELPPRQRAVVALRYWDGLTETQTAAILGCSTGTVRSQASRALAKLRTSPHLHDGSTTR